MKTSTYVLAVDDNRIHAYALEKTLQAIGFRVQSVHSGAEALNAISTDNPHAILLDVHLPDMSGFDVCASVRSNTKLKQPAIVFHSASNSSEDNFVRAHELGADAFLTYPIETEALTAVILRAVAVRRGSGDTRVLTCWKDIARFFNKGVRTVQRWEALGMPVHRPSGDKSIVFADPEELRRWAYSSRSLRIPAADLESSDSEAAS